MAFDFDPDAVLEDLRKNRVGGRPPAKVAKAAKVETVEVSGDGVAGQTLAGLAGLAGGLPPAQNLRVPEEAPIEPPAAGEAPPAKVANSAKPSLHLQLVNALARELFDDGGREKTWLIDTSVRALTPLLEQAPEKVDPAAWRAAVMRLSETLTASGRRISHVYDEQLLITFPQSALQPVAKPAIRPLSPGDTDASRGLDWHERSFMAELGFTEADLRGMGIDQAREIIAAEGGVPPQKRYPISRPRPLPEEAEEEPEHTVEFYLEQAEQDFARWNDENLQRAKEIRAAYERMYQ